MKTIGFLVTTLALALFHNRLEAQVFTFSNLNEAIPDGQPAGLSDIQTIASNIGQIGSLEVGLTISGDFNGDLYAYLRHNGAESVLLNRPGRTALNLDGYDDSGFRITLSDAAVSGDVHTYRGSLTLPANTPVTGSWQPDGRTASPFLVLDTDPRTAGLSVFNGLAASGTWTLFVADMAAGGTSVLNSWQLAILPIPEPATPALLLTGGCLLALARRRH